MSTQPPDRQPPSFTPRRSSIYRDTGNTSPIPVGSADSPQGATPTRKSTPVEPEAPAPTRAPKRVSSRPVPPPGQQRQPRSVSGSSAAPAYPAAATVAQQPANEPYQHAGGPPQDHVPAQVKPRKRRKRRRGLIIAAVVLVVLLAWPIGLLIWANGQINRVEALSGAPGTPGTTYLLVGSDSREGWTDSPNATPGERADTIILLHEPSSGPVAVVSLPRDAYVAIPGHSSNKINAAYALGGPKLLVETVELLSGMTVDHYLEIGFTGLEDVVDALGGVELCMDQDVSDSRSKLEWEAGCHNADGATALAFSRMRYADPLGDIGRADRQRQVISAIAGGIPSPANFLNPFQTVDLLSAGLDAIRVSEGTNIIDLGKLALTFRKATGSDAVTGTPPIISLNYRPGGVGSAVQLDDGALPDFFDDVLHGRFEPGSEIGGL